MFSVVWRRRSVLIGLEEEELCSQWFEGGIVFSVV